MRGKNSFFLLESICFQDSICFSCKNESIVRTPIVKFNLILQPSLSTSGLLVFHLKLWVIRSVYSPLTSKLKLSSWWIIITERKRQGNRLTDYLVVRLRPICWSRTSRQGFFEQRTHNSFWAHERWNSKIGLSHRRSRI